MSGLTVVLGRSSPVPIRLHGPEPLAIRIYQEGARPPARRLPVHRDESIHEDMSKPNVIFRKPDGRLFVNVIAEQPGTAPFRIDVLFSDGGVAARRVQIPVKLPDEKALLINALNDISTGGFATPVTILHLSAKSPGNTRRLFPFVAFGNPQWMFSLSATYVTFSLLGDGHDPVVSLDAATGTVTALRPGHALVITRFDGAQSETCVVVTDDAIKGDPSNCEDLRGSTNAAEH